MKYKLLVVVIAILLFLLNSSTVVHSESEEIVPVAVLYSSISNETGCLFFYKYPSSQGIYTNCKGPFNFYGISDKTYACPKNYSFSEEGSTVSRWVRYGGSNGKPYCTIIVMSYTCVEENGICTGGLCLEGFDTKSECEDKTKTETEVCWGCCNKDGK